MTRTRDQTAHAMWGTKWRRPCLVNSGMCAKRQRSSPNRTNVRQSLHGNVARFDLRSWTLQSNNSVVLSWVPRPTLRVVSLLSRHGISVQNVFFDVAIPKENENDGEVIWPTKCV